jgi:hypothetical protein
MPSLLKSPGTIEKLGPKLPTEIPVFVKVTFVTSADSRTDKSAPLTITTARKTKRLQRREDALPRAPADK